MKGLLIKDFLVMKKYGYINFILIALFVILSFVSANNIFFNLFAVLLAYIIIVSTFAYDESSKWNRYEIVTPISRVASVTEKYLLLIIFIGLLVIISALKYVFKSGYTLNETMEIVSILCIYGFTIPAIMFPINFKFGYIKAKIINMIVTILFVISLYSNVFINFDFKPLENIDSIYFLPYIIIGVVFVFLFISWCISVLIYSKKQF